MSAIELREVRQFFVPLAAIVLAPFDCLFGNVGRYDARPALNRYPLVHGARPTLRVVGVGSLASVAQLRDAAGAAARQPRRDGDRDRY